MGEDLISIFESQGGVATAAQVLTYITRRHLEELLEATAIERIWHGIYSLGSADDAQRLKGLDLSAGTAIAICLGTAARVFGFDTEDTMDLHVLNPERRQMRPGPGLVVHRRDGAPL